MQPSRAVDGYMETNPFQCDCCTVTDRTRDPWLSLDLRHVYMIYRVVIYGGTDSQLHASK